MKRIVCFILTLLLVGQFALAADTVGYFRVGVAPTKYGVVAISAGAAPAGKTVYAEGRPTEGFELTSFKVMADGKEVETEIVEGLYAFTMPAAVVTIHATFAYIATELFPFADVPESAWCREAVEYVFERGVMNGADGGHFAPTAPTSRAMLWTMLARDAQQSVTGGETWYDYSQKWAVRVGITDGADPMGTVTREELATMLYRYAQLGGEGFTGSWMFLLKNPDAASISDWASEAMHWCVMKGILSGREDGSLDPQGTATRAEVAAVMMRFMEREK